MLLTSLISLLACQPSSADNLENRGTSNDSALDTAEVAETGGDTAVDTGQEETGEQPDKTWTILVFMNGDNDLEPWALADMNEMETVGSTDDFNVVVQMDRGADYATGDGDWTGARRYLVQADSDEHAIGSPVLAELGNVDSGAAQTMVDFAKWGLENYPARHYAFILWDHGTGWSIAGERKKGVSEDYSSDSDLSVAQGELAGMLADLTEGRDKLDIIGFDACTMALWEVAWSVEPYASVMVGSQDYEALSGWAYDAWLADLAQEPTMDAEELGAAIALRFHEIPDSTQSVLNLDNVPALTASLEQLADKALDSGTAPELLWTAASGAQGFDGPYSSDHDLSDLLSRIGAASTDPGVLAAVGEAQAAAEAVTLTSYNQGGRVKNALGLSIYSPAEGYMPGLYQNAPWSVATRWDEFIAAAAEKE